jgi:hypothetical protein
MLFLTNTALIEKMLIEVVDFVSISIQEGTSTNTIKNAVVNKFAWSEKPVYNETCIIVSKNKRCTHPITNFEHKYCGVHVRKYLKFGDETTCNAVVASGLNQGEKCINKPTHDSRYCGIHKKGGHTCNAMIKKGTVTRKCRHKCKAGNEYCGIHNPDPSDDVLTCNAVVKKGTRCRYKHKAGSEYCGKHKHYVVNDTTPKPAKRAPAAPRDEQRDGDGNAKPAKRAPAAPRDAAPKRATPAPAKAATPTPAKRAPAAPRDEQRDDEDITFFDAIFQLQEKILQEQEEQENKPPPTPPKAQVERLKKQTQKQTQKQIQIEKQIEKFVLRSTPNIPLPLLPRI